MATPSQPLDDESAISTAPIVGIAMEKTEVERIKSIKRAQGIKWNFIFPYSSVKGTFFRRVLDTVALEAGAPSGPKYVCPRCQPSDPDVTVPVITACSRGPAGVVFVECVNGHWARYPCPTP